MSTNDQDPDALFTHELVIRFQNEFYRLKAIRPPVPAKNGPLTKDQQLWITEAQALHELLQQLRDGRETPENIAKTLKTRQPLYPPAKPLQGQKPKPSKK